MAMLLAFSLPAADHAPAREWKSADGSKTLAASFVSLAGDRIVLAVSGKPSPFPLSAFSPADQQFAKNAQAIAEAAAKAGPQSFEINLVLDDGWLCRMALPGDPKKGPLIFTGETFFLATADPAKGGKGRKLLEKVIFGAGGRTFHPLQGEPSAIRSLALDVETATQLWMDTAGSGSSDPARQSPPLIEPEIQIITRRGIGLMLAKEGLVLTGESLVKNAGSLVIRIEGREEAATVLKTGPALGIALLSCKAQLLPGKFGARKPVEVGQNIFAVTLELSPGRRTLAQPALTRGIVSKLSKSDAFLHDAAIPPGSIGGCVIGEKGDVLGISFPESADASGKSKASPAAEPASLPVCIRTDAIAEFLKDTPAAAAMRSSLNNPEPSEAAKMLRASAVIVTASTEVRKTRGIAPAGKNPPPGGPVTGFSLSLQGVRHNSKCRFYSPQRPCAPTDGRPCKTCGG